jgi:hypothetical protein
MNSYDRLCDGKTNAANYESSVKSSLSLSNEVMKTEMHMNIDCLQTLDLMIHDDMQERILSHDFTKLMALFRSSFQEAKIGDVINGGKVVEIFTHTIWILHDQVTHNYCCNRESYDGTCHFCGEDIPETGISICGQMVKKEVKEEENIFEKCEV